MNINFFKIVLALGFVACVTPAFAEPMDFSLHPWEISIQGGGVIPVEDKSDVGSNFQGRVTYDVTPNVALGVTAGWQSYDFTANSASGDVDFGDLHGIPLLATIIYKMPIASTDNHLVPYLVGGLGTVFWSFNENEGIDAEDDNTFAGQLGVGVDYYFSSNFAIFGEASYLISNDLNSDTTVNGAPSRLEGEVSDILVGVGLKLKI